MTSIRTTLMIAGTAALLGASAASAQSAGRAQGSHNSDGSHGLRSYTAMIGDASIEDSREAGRTIATAPKVKTDKAVALAEAAGQTIAR